MGEHHDAAPPFTPLGEQMAPRALASRHPVETTYAHIDIEDVDPDCIEKDGTHLEENEYAASGKPPAANYNLSDNIHGRQQRTIARDAA